MLKIQCNSKDTYTLRCFSKIGLGMLKENVRINYLCILICSNDNKLIFGL